MTEQELRKQLYASYKHRAMLYYLIFDELRQAMDESQAIEVMQRAIRRRGEVLGQQFASFAPGDLAGLSQAFLAAIPDEGRMFSAQVEHCDEERLDIILQTCPLKDAWQEAGLDDRETAIMCRIAAAIDEGTFEGAGFSFSAETWERGRGGCCHLHIGSGTDKSRPA
ncbi:MAG: L-2-amino-thiazoline-4-carboxylic acid hydrolase [Pirellulaceae bacterium]